MPALQTCPDRQSLSDYALGRLNDAESDVIATHVRECEPCLALLDGVSEASDPFLNDLRGPNLAEAYLSDRECERIVAQCASVISNAPPSDAAAAAPPDLGVLRDYKLLRELGRGGMGTVYEAKHVPLDRRVALKVLAPERMQNREAVSRFQREMRAIGKLDHPNIVRAQDAGEVDGKHFLVMELIDGLDLAALARRTGPLPIADACELIRQAAIGLAHAHEHGLVHRDVKPSNLVVTPAGVVKVLDLGLALLAEGVGHGEELTSSGQVMGTLDYMAPEQLGDAHDVDARADIYGLGATLYRLLTGQAPYPDKRYDTPTKKLMAIATKPISPVTAHRDDVPPELLTILDRMLAKNPDDRFASAAEVATALQPHAIASNLPAAVARADTRKLDAPSTKPSTTSDLSSALIDTHPSHAADVCRERAPSRSEDGLSHSEVELSRSELQQPVPQRSSRRFIPYAAAAVLLLACGAGLASVIIRLVTPDGTLVVTLDEKLQASDVTVEIDGDRAVNVQTAEGGRALRVTLDPGTHKLRIETQDGEVLLAREIEVQRAGIHIAHAESKDDGRVAASGSPVAPTPDAGPPGAAIASGGTSATVTDSPPAQPSPSTARDREAAKWVLANGGGVELWTPGNPNHVVGNIAQLPAGSFRLTGFWFTGGPPFGTDDFSRFAELSELRSIALDHRPFGDNALRHFASHKLETLVLSNVGLNGVGFEHLREKGSLRRVDVQNNPITDEALAAVSHMPNLEFLNLDTTGVTDEGLRHLTAMTNLRELRISSTLITDGGLQHLAPLEDLRTLDVSATRISDAGLAFIAQHFQLDYLRCGGTLITDGGLQQLRNISPLKRLSVDIPPGYSSALTGDCLRNLADMDHLEELDLNGIPITDGAIPDLLRLTKLRLLVLTGTAITDASVGQLSSLPALEYLSLQNIAISDSGVEGFTRDRFPALRHLYIDGTRITESGFRRLQDALPGCSVNWAPPAQLQSSSGTTTTPTDTSTDGDRRAAEWVLQHGGRVSLWVPGGHVSHDIDSIQKLPQITFRVHTVELPNCAPFEHVATDFEFLRGLADLQRVYIVGTPWGDDIAEILADAPQLEELRLAAANVGKRGLEALRDQESLVFLDFTGNPLPEDQLSIIAELPKLERLWVQGVGLTDRGLERLVEPQNLVELIIQDNEALTDEGLAVLSKLKKLRRLGVAKTNIRDARFRQLGSLLPQLTDLGIHETGITDEGLSHLAAAKNLQALQLMGTFVTDAGLAHLRDLQFLWLIDVSRCHDITDAAMEHLARLPSLKYLALAETKLTDAAVEQLRHISTLTHLDIRGTRITESGYNHLKEALPNCTIQWEPPSAD